MLGLFGVLQDVYSCVLQDVYSCMFVFLDVHGAF